MDAEIDTGALHLKPGEDTAAWASRAFDAIPRAKQTRIPSGWHKEQFHRSRVGPIVPLDVAIKRRLTVGAVHLEDQPALEAAIKGETKSKEATAGYSILSPSDLLASPLIRDLVRGVFPRIGIAGVIGASMSGKGFLIIDMMAVLAESGFWFGRRADKVKIIYIPLEGAGGLHKRFRAWKKGMPASIPKSALFPASPSTCALIRKLLR